MVEQIYGVEVGYGKSVTSWSTEIYKVTSGKSFKVQTLILTNKSGLSNIMVFDCVSSDISSKKLDVLVGASDTVVLDKDDLMGVTDFMSSVLVYASVSSAWIHAGGIEY